LKVLVRVGMSVLMVLSMLVIHVGTASADTCYAWNRVFPCTCTSVKFIGDASEAWSANCTVAGDTLECTSWTSDKGPWECFQEMEEEHVDTTPDADCTLNLSAFRIQVGGGFSRSDVYSSYYNFSNRPCGWRLSRDPGNLAARVQYLKWNGSAWGVCRDSDWSFNTVLTYGWSLTWDFGSQPPCGSGYYGTWSGAYNNSARGWMGGWLFSGYRLLSDASILTLSTDTAISSPPPTADIGPRAGRIVSLDRSGRTIGTVETGHAPELSPQVAARQRRPLPSGAIAGPSQSATG
jgi:hypothetical protein